MKELNPSEVPAIHEQLLPNGLRHIHAEHKIKKFFFFGLYVKAGTRWENQKNSGISHFLEHMMFRGSKKFPSFMKLAEKFENFGGDWNAATSYEHTEYTYSGLSHVAKPLIQLFSDLIQAPLLLDEQKEKEIILREIEDEMNEYDEFLDLDFQSLKLAWPEEGFFYPITGTKNSVKKITRERLQDYYQRYYYPGNIVLCTVGGDSSLSIRQTVAENFNYSPDLKERKRGPIGLVEQVSEQQQFKFAAIKNSDNQYQVQINFICEGEWSDSVGTYHLISHILCSGFSSRLMRRLREERGLLYSIESASLEFSDKGLFSFNYGVVNKNFYLVLEEILSCLKTFKNHGPNQDELERAKEQEALELESLGYDFDSYSYSLARNKLWNKPLSPFVALEKIKGISRERIQQESRLLFKKSSCIFVVLGEGMGTMRSQVEQLLTRYL